MKLLFDFLPILLFFIAFKLYGVYVATAVAMIASALQVLIFWLKHRRFEKMHIITLIMVLLLGSATLFLHNPMFIKWKPTAIYWAFAVLFFGSQYVGKKTLIQHMMDSTMELPYPVWQKLNMSWTAFFVAMGFINLYVVYHFSTNTWVNFKLFGSIGLTLLFVFLQAIYMAKHVQSKESQTN